MADKVNEARDLDTSAASRGVWLVKVPKYLSDTWKKADGRNEVGKLRIARPRFPGGKPEVVFTLNESLHQSGSAGPNVPKDHKFVLTGVGNQTVNVLAQGPAERIAVEGKVIQRAECRPMGDANYMKLKRSQFEETNKPKREVVQLDSAVNVYKPVDNHQFNLEHDRKKKDEGKRARADKDHVMENLFSAFEKHQYYNLRDLVNLTRQPVTYLKEILQEICVYNMKAPHKNMWELKPEFRHYKDDK